MLLEQIASEGLLALARRGRSKPVVVRDIAGHDDVDVLVVEDAGARQHVGDRVEHVEAPVKATSMMAVAGSAEPYTQA
jgi:hypothetical protein